MNRRGFFSSLATFVGAASLSPHIFIPKFEPVKWKTIASIPPIISCSAFTQFLVDMSPVYDERILKDVGVDPWIGHIRAGIFPHETGSEYHSIRRKMIFGK